MKLFGKVNLSKTTKKVTTADNDLRETIHMFREKEDMLIKKQDLLERKIKNEIDTAKTYATKNKKLALQALKRKRRYEKQLNQIDGILTTIEMQREALEGVKTNTAVLESLSKAAKVLKHHNTTMDVDKVEELMDQLTEHQDNFNDISEALSSPVGFADEVDEEELQKELEEFEQEELDMKLLQDIPIVVKPAVGGASPETPKVVDNKPGEEEDLRELEAWGTS